MTYQPPAPRQRTSDLKLFLWISFGIVLAATLVAVGIITTRSDDSDGKAAPGVTAQTQPASTPAPSGRAGDETFMAELRRTAPALVAKHAQFNLLPNMGSIACGYVQLGKDRDDIATRIMGSTYTHDEALAIVDAAKPAYCP